MFRLRGPVPIRGCEGGNVPTTSAPCTLATQYQGHSIRSMRGMRMPVHAWHCQRQLGAVGPVVTSCCSSSSSSSSSNVHGRKQLHLQPGSQLVQVPKRRVLAAANQAQVQETETETETADVSSSSSSTSTPASTAASSTHGVNEQREQLHLVARAGDDRRVPSGSGGSKGSSNSSSGSSNRGNGSGSSLSADSAALLKSQATDKSSSSHTPGADPSAIPSPIPEPSSTPALSSLGSSGAYTITIQNADGQIVIEKKVDLGLLGGAGAGASTGSDSPSSGGAIAGSAPGGTDAPSGNTDEALPTSTSGSSSAPKSFPSPPSTLNPSPPPGTVGAVTTAFASTSSTDMSDVFPRFPSSSVPARASMDPLITFDDLAQDENAQGRPVTMSSIAPEDTPEFLTDVEEKKAFRPANWLSNQRDLATLSYAVIIGGVVATSVFTFDVAIQYIHDIPDNLAKLGIGGGRSMGLVLPFMVTAIPFRCVMPVGAGVAVSWLQGMGFAPPLKVVTRAVDSVKDDVKNASLPQDYGQVVRKALASAITLGSGASLGPEAPSVELGANTAAVIVPKQLSRRRQRMLLAAGAAAGVSAAFDAPVAGALFAVEFVLKSSRLGLDRLSTSTVFVSTSVAAAVVGFLRIKGQALGVSGAASHLVGRIPYFSIQPNLLYDVAQFSLLGVGCAAAAVALYEGVRVSEIVLRPLPRWVSAPLAGALCGVIAFHFPTVQYGYVNLEEVFRDSPDLPVGGLFALLAAKVAATSVCVGGGLVGGLFAPSLFLGAVMGDIVGHFFYDGVADANSFVVVGAAAVLGAACRAPLTAIALMVEITRDTGLFVPLLAAIGTASLVTDYVEGAFSTWLESKLVEMYIQEKSMFWAAGLVGNTNKKDGPIDAVETAMGVRTNLYVRHSLPLSQARDAMVSNNVKAAVVVDDNFSPVGVAYLDDVEEEMVRQRLANQRDSNFGSMA